MENWRCQGQAPPQLASPHSSPPHGCACRSASSLPAWAAPVPARCASQEAPVPRLALAVHGPASALWPPLLGTSSPVLASVPRPRLAAVSPSSGSESGPGGHGERGSDTEASEGRKGLVALTCGAGLGPQLWALAWLEHRCAGAR